MRKYLLWLALFTGFNLSASYSQKVYSTSSGELIFSFANVNNSGAPVSSLMRFTCFFHTGEYWHMDLSPMLGIFTGVGIRNVGFITKGQNDPAQLADNSIDEVKRRSYTLGFPLAIKFGSFKDNFYLYAGGEYELLFHYKEKHFKGGTKIKTTEWFSNKTNRFLPSVFVGMQLPRGMNLKLKYYLYDFMNRDYVDENGNKPYANLKSQVFYLSLSFNVRTRRVKDKITHKDTNIALL